jgi:hypothetical protein
MSQTTATECLLLPTLLYAAALAAFGNSGPFEQWLSATQPIVNLVLFFVYPVAREDDVILGLYRHVQFVSVVSTGAWILFVRRWVPGWSRQTAATYRKSHNNNPPVRTALEEAHGLSSLGAFSAVYLVLFDPTLNQSLALSFRGVVLLVPILSAVAFLLICQAIIFRRLAGPRMTE